MKLGHYIHMWLIKIRLRQGRRFYIIDKTKLRAQSNANLLHVYYFPSMQELFCKEESKGIFRLYNKNNEPLEAFVDMNPANEVLLYSYRYSSYQGLLKKEDELFRDFNICFDCVSLKSHKMNLY